MRYFLMLAFLNLWYGIPLWSQNRNILDQIGIEQGLSQGFVTSILQDREGFIWVGTQNGLNRYDGYRFRVFEHDAYDTLSLSGNFIKALAEHGDFLLVGAASHGLNIFHKKTERFFRLPFSMEEPCYNPGVAHSGNRAPGNSIAEILTDADGNIWLLTGRNHEGEQFLVKVTLPEGFWEKLPDRPSLVFQIKTTFWCCSAQQNSQNLLAIDHLRRLRCSSDGKRIFWLDYTQCWTTDAAAPQLLPFNHAPVPPQKIFNFVPGASGEGVFLQDMDGKTWFSNDPNLTDWTELPRKIPFVLYFDQKFLLTARQRTNQIFRSQADPREINFEKPLLKLDSLDGRNVVCIDRTGDFWSGDFANGMLKFNPSSLVFEHHLAGVSVMSKPVALPGGGYLFEQTTRLNFFSRASDKAKWTEFQHFLTENDLHPLQISAQPASSSEYWAFAGNSISQKNFLIKYNIAGARPVLEHWVLKYHLHNALSFQFDETGKIWFSTDDQLVCFDPKNETCTDFDFSQLKLGDPPVLALQKTADGSWWLATDQGLLRARPKKNAAAGFDFTLFQTNLHDRNSLNENNLACLLTDPHDASVLWIGAKGGGLNRLDVRTLQFTHLSTQDGLPNNVIYGILPDSSGHLWLSSNRGLIRYLPATGEIKNYRRSDGLQSDEFNTNAYAVGFRGELIFGGVNGLNVFFPNSVAEHTAAAKTLITGLKINNRAVKVGDLGGKVTTAIHFCKNLVLSAEQNQLTFEFASLDFSSQNKCQYRYYLEGAEAEWAHQGEEPSAVYTNLPPGKYTFKVLGSNANLEWDGTAAEMSVEILPPWYRTWWAYFVYSLLAMGLIVWYIRSRTENLRLQIDLEKKKTKAKVVELAFERKRLESLELAQRLETERQLAAQNREEDQRKLAAFTQQLIEKSHQLAALQEKLSDNDEHPAAAEREAVLPELYKAHILTQDDWEHFRVLFEQANPGFFQKLSNRYPNLTGAETRLLLLTKIGLKRADAAAMLGVLPQAIKKTSIRLRKKLGVEESSLEEILEGL